MKILSYATLLLLIALSLAPDLWRGDAAAQNRQTLDARPSLRYPLGTDEFGRDRLTRLLLATRTSILLAPAAALLAVGLAAIAGVCAGAARGRLRVFDAITDLILSLPWLFVLLAVRASLPLDTPPLQLAITTFVFLALLAWAAPARLLERAVARLQKDDFALQSRALGIPALRIWTRHILPNLRPLLAAQFWICTPLFVLGEANLGLLGLGIPEPTPSLGGMLRELQGYGNASNQPWLYAPIVVLILLTASLSIIARSGEMNA